MGKQSMEGYEGGNWPSTTGNSSGGGRGNAEPSYNCEDWGDCHDAETRLPSIFDIVRRNEIEAEARERGRRTPPHIPNNARRYRGKLIKGVFPGVRGITLDMGDRRPMGFMLSDHYDDFFFAIEEPYLLDLWLIGDEVEIAVDERNRIIHYHNADLTEARVKAEGEYSRKQNHLTNHEAENEVRSGESFHLIPVGQPTDGEKERQRYSFDRTPHQGFIENEKKHINWRIFSGDYEIPGFGFRNLTQAKNCLIYLIKRGQLGEFDGQSFRLRSNSSCGIVGQIPQLNRCRLVNAKGSEPNKWDHRIPLVKNYTGAHVPGRNADRTEYED